MENDQESEGATLDRKISEMLAGQPEQEQKAMMKFAVSYVGKSVEEIVRAKEMFGLKTNAGVDHVRAKTLNALEAYALIKEKGITESDVENLMRFVLIMQYRGKIEFFRSNAEFKLLASYGQSQNYAIDKYCSNLAYKAWDVLTAKVRENIDNIGESVSKLEAIIPTVKKCYDNNRKDYISYSSTNNKKNQ